MNYRDEGDEPVADLTNCDREPIHVPGRIQPHGVLLALREGDLAVVRASVNVESMLGISADAILGTPFDALVEPGRRDGVRSWLASPDVEEANPFRIGAGAGPTRPTFDGAAHRADGLLIVELEGPRPGDDGPPPDYSRFIRNAMARLRAARDLRAFCRAAADALRELTGFDRVLVYRFDDDWHGEVVAETLREGLSPFMGLHFPASDIPEPARALYDRSRLRMIVDVDAPTVPLAPAAAPPLDLGRAGLRAFAPVHVRYLRNLGARTSMSIALMRDDRLWGLLGCMHYDGPRYIPAPMRAACEFLGVLASMQLGVKVDAEGLEYGTRLRAVRERLLQRMAEEPDLVRALMGDARGLLELTDARGAAVVHGDACAVVGEAPGEAEIRRLAAWLKRRPDGGAFHTDSLPSLHPEAMAYKDRACGLAAIWTAGDRGHLVLWFRPEVIQTVDWGGDPSRPVEPGSPPGELNPRRSFELWKEEVHLRSLPWRPAELAAASALRDAVVAVVVRRAEELARLNAELERSNAELDAFAFSTSHDMKEPLRGINNYATFLMEDYADVLDAEGVARLKSLVWLSQRMEDLIESMLKFSRLGRAELATAEVDVDEAVREVLRAHATLLEENDVEVSVPRPLPTVRCDRVQLGQVLGNLLTNAVKYNDRPRKTVEIGYDEGRPAGGGDGGGDGGDGPAAAGAPVFYVRDNGIGIPERHHETIFRLFKRLHGRDKYGGGTGAGLTFARKIVDRHGGAIWVESTPGAGSTFRFRLGE